MKLYFKDKRVREIFETEENKGTTFNIILPL